MSRTAASIALTALALSAHTVLAQGAAPPASLPGSRITVVGQGTVEVEPDVAVAIVRIRNRAPSPAAALDANTAAAARVMALARSQAIGASDVRTSSVSLSAVNKLVPNERGNSQQVPDGFEASNGVNVNFSLKGEGIARLGRFLRAAVGEGANEVSGVSFELSDPDRAREDAAAAAVVDAARQAQRMAAAAGVQLGAVESIRPPRPDDEGRGQADLPRRSRVLSTVPLAAGAITVNATVAVTWTLVAP